MDLNDLCMGCMESKNQGDVCSLCGWVEGTAPESPLHIAPSSILIEKYLLGRVLGQGGFGITYLSWDLYLDRKLAIKEYFPRELVYRDTGTKTVSIMSGTHTDRYHYGLTKFLAEAKNLARFEGHPNIVSVRDYFEENSTAYMVMNYLDGVTFSDYLFSMSSRLSFDSALQIIMPILDALRFVHEAGLMHRDISPDNIMITKKGRVMLLDFGAARHALNEAGKKYSVIIKPGFAPEEQYRSNGVQGPWTDIYAVAATLYYAITSRMPPDSLDRLGSDTLVPPSQMDIEIDPAIESALLKALSVHANNRFQSVEDFQKALFLKYPSGQLHLDNNNTSVGFNDPGLVSNNAEIETAGNSSLEISNKFSVEQPERALEHNSGSIFVTVTIGRSADNDIVLADALVSRHHASLTYEDGDWHLNDLGSTHGSFLNDTRVSEKVKLEADSSLRISNTKLYYKNYLLLSENGDVLANLGRILQNRNNYLSKPNSLVDSLLKYFSDDLGRKLLIIGAVVLLIIVFVIILANVS